MIRKIVIVLLVCVVIILSVVIYKQHQTIKTCDRTIEWMGNELLEYQERYAELKGRQ